MKKIPVFSENPGDYLEHNLKKNRILLIINYGAIMSAVKKLFCLLSILSIQINGQFVVDWESTWNSPYSKFDRAEVMNIDSDGNIVVAGTSYSGELISTGDVALVKYLPDGSEMWNKRFNIGSYDEALGIYFDAANNIVVGVKGADSSIYFPSFMLVKYDPDGNLIYANKISLYVFGYSANITGSADKLHLDNFNQLVIGGSYWQVKMNFDGSVTSSHAVPLIDTLGWYGTSTNLDESRSELTVPVSGWSNSLYRYFAGLIKKNSDGTIKWVKNIMSTGQYQAYGNAMLVSNDGFTYLGLQNKVWEAGLQVWKSDQHIIKFGTGGEILWDKTLEATAGNQYSSEVGDFAFDSGGNLIVTGSIDSKFFVAKYSTAGERFLLIQDSDTMMYKGLKILPDTQHKFYVTVWDQKGSVYLIKYDGLGNQLAKIKLQGLSEYFPLELQKIMFDASKKIVLTGGKYFGGSYDFVTMKITDQLTDVEEEQNTVSDFNLFQNYPNPFNPSTKIKFSLPSPLQGEGSGVRSVTLKVYDVLGNEIATLLNEEKTPGTYEVTFNAAGLASGVYFYKIQSGSFTETRKLILMK